MNEILEIEQQYNNPAYSEKNADQDFIDTCLNSPADIFVSFGGVVLYFRSRKGLNQDEFAKTLGISRGQLAAIENNHYPKLTLETVDAIARELGINRISLIRLWYQAMDMPS